MMQFYTLKTRFAVGVFAQQAPGRYEWLGETGNGMEGALGLVTTAFPDQLANNMQFDKWQQLPKDAEIFCCAWDVCSDPLYDLVGQTHLLYLKNGRASYESAHASIPMTSVVLQSFRKVWEYGREYLKPVKRYVEPGQHVVLRPF